MQQIAIDFEAAARAGMDRAQRHADQANPGWSDSAYRMLCEYAMRRTQFTSVDLRDFARDAGLASPPTDKAWGPVFLRAARLSIIEKVGYAKHPERHGSPTPIWRSRVVRC